MASDSKPKPGDAPKAARTLALPCLVRQSRQSRHDGALPRAPDEFRAHARRAAQEQPPGHRHRPDRQRHLAVQPPPPGARRARARRHPRRRRHPDRVSGPPDPGDRQAADRRARPQPHLPRPGRVPLRLLHGRRGADHRLRQDDARDDHGRGHGEHPGHRAVGRADAQRLLRRRPGRLGHRGLVRAPGTCRRPDRLRRVPRHGRGGGAVGRPLQHDGHGAVDEQHGRGAGDVAAGLRVDPGALPRARRRWPTSPAGGSSRW